MARELYLTFPAAKRVLDEADAALPGLLRLMWDGPAEELQLTANQQPALVAAGAAAYAAYLEAGGQRASFGAGHSLGEYTAHVAAGSLGIADAVRLVRRRGEYMQQAVPEGLGAMAAVLKLDDGRIAGVLRRFGPPGAPAAGPGDDEGQGGSGAVGLVEIANLNAPGQTVISGEARAVELASEELKALGARVIPLKVSAPFHCRLMAPAAARLAADLRATSFAEPAFAIVCNVTAETLTTAAAAPELLTAQVTAPVRWVECVRRLVFLGAERFLEFGSGEVLTGLVKRIVPDAPAQAVADPEGVEEAVRRAA